MPLLGEATMIAIYDVDSGWEARHDEWHSHEHLHERVSLPGFRRGRRYTAEGPLKRDSRITNGAASAGTVTGYGQGPLLRESDAPEPSKPSVVNGPLRSDMPILCISFSRGPPKRQPWSVGARLIDEIATQVGYASRSHFAQAFKKHTGESPHALREPARASSDLLS